KPYTRIKPPKAPKLDRFKPIIDAILDGDQQAPRKQRHTAAQVFRRLQQEEGYAGGYDQVRRYIAQRRRRERETFLPLEQAPGQRAEADFGQIYVDFPEGRRAVPVLLVTWAYSYCPFAIALPTERTEAILHGLVEAFAFFGCVPQEFWWDNPTTVAVEILTGRRRKMNARYAAMASHYNFEPLFCMPARGNEKPWVENRVKNLQRRWATPVPRMKDLAELNAYLRHCCLEDRHRVVSGKEGTIGQRFEEERTAALPLPPRSFDACVAQPSQVDKYQTVAYDRNRYSVPRRFAFQTVTVKGYVDRIDVVAHGEVVACHPRSYETGRQLLDPLHYLTTLARKPGYLDHSPVFRHWTLPPSFDALRQRLEAQHGPTAGARHYARVLQLLAEHPLERIARALDGCQNAEHLSAEWILQRTEQLRREALPQAIDLSDWTSAVGQVQVPPPTLNHFNLLLFSGDQTDDTFPQPTAVAESQSQAVAVADHAGRV
ncbi:MAG: IS21 family transposase, partial [Planctomycetes bacterium]|nr:IS21 family transposase [Planctomycetota bacterium]